MVTNTQADHSSVIRELLDDLQPVLDQVRLMERFFTDVVEELPETRPLSPQLRGGYVTIFNDEYKHDTYRLAALALELLKKR